MNLDLRSFGALVRQQAAVMQAQASIGLDFGIGSVLRSWIESVAGVGLLLQKQALDVLRTTRLASSTGTDVDTFVNDFGFQREPATSATGIVTFYLSGGAFIPVGSLVKTADLSLTYSVTTDPSIAGYNSTLNGYNVPGSTTSIDLPVVCTTTGRGGNILAQSISLLGSSIPGVNAVNNTLAFANGSDAQTDASVREGFLLYLAGLARATVISIESAIQSVQSGLSYQVLENTLPDGTTRAGTITVVLDDGSGTPPAALVKAVTAAIEAVRPAGSMFSVIAPTVVPVTLSCNISVLRGTSLQAAQAAVGAALAQYIDGVGTGEPLLYLKLASIAFAAANNITDVENLLVQGATANLPAVVGRSYKLGATSIA